MAKISFTIFNVWLGLGNKWDSMGLGDWYMDFRRAKEGVQAWTDDRFWVYMFFLLKNGLSCFSWRVFVFEHLIPSLCSFVFNSRIDSVGALKALSFYNWQRWNLLQTGGFDLFDSYHSAQHRDCFAMPRWYWVGLAVATFAAPIASPPCLNCKTSEVAETCHTTGPWGCSLHGPRKGNIIWSWSCQVSSSKRLKELWRFYFRKSSHTI